MNDAIAYNNIIDPLYHTLTALLKLHQRIIPVLKDELNSIISEDTNALDECLKLLQSLTFQLRALEKESENILQANGIFVGNLSELIQQMPENEQRRFLSLKEQFNTSLREITFYRDKCEIMLKTRLFRIEKKRLSAAQNKNTTNKDHTEGQTSPSPSKAFEITV
ncbi:MAG: hypothetical protein CVV01_01250 [Firmicutes bacterium HGW-Firmicutes-6]|nr:MAG: hypothetical protein CVV01_01250 [Firmicutes bacterium HGW-Firmicutes-6]